jgi:hypothetical protein
MGGKAFAQLHPSAKFPRMPPSVYLSLKTRVLPRIAELYTHIGVPYEAPQKIDHGDLDIIVAQPITGEEVPYEQVRKALGAALSIPLDGFRTSNFAVPLQPEDFISMGIEDSDSEVVFYQIDIHVCETKEDMDQHIFYHSYGDLGMLIGVTARGVGLTCSSNGLKVSTIHIS